MSRLPKRRHFSFERLEPRILLSADALGGALGADLLHDADPPFERLPSQQLDLEQLAASFSEQYVRPLLDQSAPAALDLEGLGALIDFDSEGDTRHELIFLDAGIEGAEELLQALMSDSGSTQYSVFHLDGSTDGIAQISDILQDQEGLDAIHVLSHGGEGRVQLGASWLDSTTLETNREAIAGWAAALGEGADLLIYGCDLAGNAAGEALLDSLVELTGADVAGSDDLTGSAVLGGDWELEVQKGDIDTATLFTLGLQAGWTEVLAAPTTSGIADFTLVQDADDSVIDLLTVFDDAEDANDALIYTVFSNTNTSLFTAVTIDNATNTLTLDYAPSTYGVTDITIRATDSDTEYVDETFTVTVVPNENLLITTNGNPNGGVSGEADGLTAWFDHDVIQAGGAALASEPGNSEAFFSQWFNLDSFGSGQSIDAIHYVTTELTIGTDNTVVVKPGDLLLSIEGWGSYDLDGTGGGDLSVSKDDVFIFRPDAPGVYTAGKFLKLLEDVNGTGDNITAITLVETETVLDDYTLPAGTFLFSVDQGNGNAIKHLVPGDLNDDPIGTVTTLVDGDETHTGLLIAGQITGLELIETDTSFAGTTLASDLILVSVDFSGSSTDVMFNDLTVNQHDVFSIDLTQTTLGSLSTVGNAALLFQGEDVGLDNSSKEQLVGMSLRPNADPANAVVISGTLDEGQSLAADATAITDTDGVGTFSYQWQRDGALISGATLINYTLVGADVGSNISVMASYTDGTGILERVTSAATGEILSDNNPPSGLPAITGTVTKNQTLTADTTGISDADGLGTFSYQWLNDSVAISGATSNTYTLAGTDVGDLISVEVSYTDGGSRAEGPLTSAQTAAVADAGAAPLAVADAYSVNKDTELDSHDSWYNTDWSYRRALAFDNSAQTESLSGSAVLITLDDTRIDYSKTQNNGEDLRFVDGDGTLLAHEIEVWNESGSSYVWVQVPEIDGGSSTDFVWMYYGNGSVGDGQDVASVWDQSHKGVWHLDEASGTYDDSTRNVNNLDLDPLLGVVQGATGQIGGAGNFDGGNDYLESVASGATLVDLQITGDVTLESWVYIDTLPASGYAGIIEFAGNGSGRTGEAGNYLYYMGLMPGGDIQLGHEYGDQSNEFPVMGVSLEAGQWYQLTAVRDTSAKEWQLYVDGALAATETYTNDATGGTTGQIWVGWDSVGFDGTIDELRISDTARTADWISAQHASGKDTFVTYGFEQGKAGVLGNDFDADGDPLTAVLDNGPSNAASFSLNADGSFTYMPTASYTGVDSFTYKANDGADSNVVTVNIVVGNVPPSGLPAITGTTTEDQLLTADTTGISDANGLGDFSYQWKRDGVDIGSATSSTYMLDDADIGTDITAEVSFTDGGGTAETVLSAAAGPIADLNEAPTDIDLDNLTVAENSASGMLVGNLTASDPDVAGASSFSLVAGIGDTDNASFAIVGGELQTNAVLDFDTQETYTVRVQVSDGALSYEEAFTITATAVNEAPTDIALDSTTVAEESASGTVVGNLTASDPDSAGASAFTLVSGTGDTDNASFAIVGGELQTNAVLDFDTQETYTVRVQVSDGALSYEEAFTITATAVNEAPTDIALDNLTVAEESASGTVVGNLTASDPDSAGASAFTLVAGLGDTDNASFAIVGGELQTNAVLDFDTQETYTVRVQVSDGALSYEEAFTINATPVNDAPVGNVVITGAATENTSLIADTTGISDDDGLGAFSYQWHRDGGDITDATASSYTLVDADVDAVISVTVSYTDAQGTPESLTSLNTAVVANVNDVPVGNVAITGVLIQDEELTADTDGISDDDGLGTFSYQWYSDITPVGTDSSTYTLVASDVDAVMTVSVSFIDAHNNPEGPLTSGATTAVADSNDPVSGDVTITGVASEDEVLTADTSALVDTDGLGTFSYQWYRGVSPVGADESTYTLADADVDAVMSVTVSYVDGNNTPESVTSAATAVVDNVNDTPVGAVIISGTVSEDQLLTADTSGISDDDGLGTFSYQWYRGVTPVGSDTDTYTLGDADVGAVMSVVVSYTDDRGEEETVTSAGTGLVGNVNDPPTGAVVISGAVSEDQVLTADTSGLSDADGPGAFSYEWLRDGASVGAGSSYTLGEADVGASMSVTVSYIDAQGTTESVTSAPTAAVANVNDAPVGSVTITGTAAENEILTADASSVSDDDGLGTFSYQWYRGVTPVGADASTYTLGDADVGAVMSVVVSYTDDGGFAENVTSAATAAVTNVNTTPAGDVIITGSASEDQVLIADTSGLSDDDDLGPLSYQWYRGATPVGADANSYTPGDADVGEVISVTVSYIDGDGAEESVASAPTVAVTNINDPLSGAVVIEGDSKIGETLTANTSGIADEDGLGTINYQWLRNGTPVAAGSTYTLGDADVGAAMSVTVTYVDGQGTEESSASAPTAVVVGSVPPVVEPEPEPDPTDIRATEENLTIVIDDLLSNPDSPLIEISPVVDVVVENEPAGVDTTPQPNPDAGTGGGEDSGEQGGEAGDPTADETSLEEQTDGEADGDLAAGEEQLLRPPSDVGGTPHFSSTPVVPGSVSFSIDVSLDSGDIVQVRLDNISELSESVVTTVVATEQVALERLRQMYTAMNDGDAWLGSTGFVSGIDHLREEVMEEAQLQKMVVGSGFAVTSGLSVGYIIWVARSGVLLSSVLSSLPAWRFIDPFPVLSSANQATREDEDEESLESIATGANGEYDTVEDATAVDAESEPEPEPEPASEEPPSD
jgi:hypothetical protein